jgi:hypothetical protein
MEMRTWHKTTMVQGAAKEHKVKIAFSTLGLLDLALVPEVASLHGSERTWLNQHQHRPKLHATYPNSICLGRKDCKASQI